METDFFCAGCGFKTPPENKQALRRWLCTNCFRKEQTALFESICPPLYQRTDPARLPAKQFREVMAWKFGPRGLLLAGSTGRCKTRCAWMLVKRLIIEDGLSVAAFDCVGFGRELERRYREEESVPDWLDKLGTQTPVVFMDDLGKLKFTDRAETELFGLLEQRCAHELPTIATTNDHGDTLVERMTENRGAPFIRRLRDRDFFTPIGF